jgi:hypothetical protein
MSDSNKTAAETKAVEIARILELAAVLKKTGFNEGYLKKISVVHRLDLLETLEAECQFVKDYKKPVNNQIKL